MLKFPKSALFFVRRAADSVGRGSTNKLGPKRRLLGQVRQVGRATFFKECHSSTPNPLGYSLLSLQAPDKINSRNRRRASILSIKTSSLRFNQRARRPIIYNFLWWPNWTSGRVWRDTFCLMFTLSIKKHRLLWSIRLTIFFNSIKCWKFQI